jgi:hypothetical protein
MSTLRRHPLVLVLIALFVVIAFYSAKSGRTQTLKNQKKEKEIVTAVRRGGLREAAKLNKNYVATERTSGWAKYDLEGLATASSNIILGTPILSTPKLSDSGEQVLTDHQIRVEQIFKGDLKLNQVLTLTVIGGKVVFDDGSTAEILTSDLGPIEIGKTYIFFLNLKEKSDPISYRLTGGGQGLFEVAADSTVEPRGDKVDSVQKYKHEAATNFIDEIKLLVKKHPETTRCCQ